MSLWPRLLCLVFALLLTGFAHAIDCIDADGDGFGDGFDCLGPDVDDNASSCTDSTSDFDGDGVPDCLDLCYDLDFDDYGRDQTNDTYGSGADAVGSCTTDGITPCSFGDAVCIDFDCDDSDPNQNPGADEIVGDDKDGNCDGSEICYVDADRDGYRTDATVSSFDERCSTASGEARAEADLDCDDGDVEINPRAAEIWYDGTDQNCDARNDYDQDFDSFISELFPGEEGGTAPYSGDCLDTDKGVYPGAPDSEGDGIDQNCDGIDGIEPLVFLDGFE